MEGLITIGILVLIISYLKSTTKKNKKKKYNNYKKYNQRHGMKQETATITIKSIGEHFNKSSREINKILNELHWIEKKDRWWMLTPTGKTKGGQELYNSKNKTKYTIWDSKIIHNTELINRIYNSSKENNVHEERKNGYNNLYPKKKQKMTKKEMKEKGDKYEEYVANFFREQGYTIAEHGKDNGVKDNGIDIIAKKEKYILFIQCKNWSAKTGRKIRDKELKITKQDVEDYMKKHPLYEMGNYKTKIIFITSENILHGSGYYYIKEHSKEIEYQVIPIHNINKKD